MCVLGRWGLGDAPASLFCNRRENRERLGGSLRQQQQSPRRDTYRAARTKGTPLQRRRAHMQARYNRVARNRPRVAGGWGAGAGARRAWTGGRLIGEAGTMREWSLNARPLTTVVAVPLCSSLWTCGWSVIPCSAFAKGPRTDRHRQGPQLLLHYSTPLNNATPRLSWPVPAAHCAPPAGQSLHCRPG